MTSITRTLEVQMSNTAIFILSSDKISETNATTSYKIVFLKVLKELVNGLYLSGVRTANFYVGYSENTKEYPLLTGPPEDDKIAKCDRENVNIPYQVTIQLTTQTETNEGTSNEATSNEATSNEAAPKKRKTSD